MQHVMVIGAGFAGLAAALRLRQTGVRVTLLDALPRPGGKAALGWEDFSSGPTVVTMPAVFRALHARLGLPEPMLTPATPTTRYSWPDGRSFAPQALAVAGRLEPTLAQLSAAEGARYRALLQEARQLYEGAQDTFLFGPPPTPARLARYALGPGRTARAGQRLTRLVQSGRHLTPFWLRFATYLGADPYRAPAVLHNVSWVELGGGVWHLAGGLGPLAGRLAAHAEERGVSVLQDARVEGLIVRGRRVLAAHTSQGVYGADAFVSAADRRFTQAWLGLRPARAQPGSSGFALQLRLTEALPDAHHVLFPADYAREWRDIRAGQLPRDPTLYLHVMGERAFLLVNAPPNPEEPPDPEGYARFLLERLQARLPLPVAEHLSLTPAVYARSGWRGALYGAAPHSLTAALKPGWTLPPYSNLVQVGGTVHPGGGVPLSLLGGWNGAGSLLGLPYDDLDGHQLIPEGL